MSTNRSLRDLPAYDEILVYDGIEPCPYLEGQAARMPLRLQLRHSSERFDRLLSEGDRRVGQMLYRPSCPTCSECVDVRIEVDSFRASRSQRRVWNKNRDLRVEMGRASVDDLRLALFNRHKLERGLGTNPLDREAYVGWLVRSCTDTRELSFFDGDRLIAVTVVDVGHETASAVYTYFDPDESARSLGTFAVLTGIEWARQQGFSHYYLGLYVRANAHLNYKAQFKPQQRLVSGRWGDVAEQDS